jgi:hypothetical protein
VISKIISDGNSFRPSSLAYLYLRHPGDSSRCWLLFPGLLSHIREDRTVYRHFVGKPDRNRSFGRRRSRWRDNTNLHFKCRVEGQDWIRKANDSKCETPSQESRRFGFSDLGQE